MPDHDVQYIHMYLYRVHRAIQDHLKINSKRQLRTPYLLLGCFYRWCTRKAWISILGQSGPVSSLFSFSPFTSFSISFFHSPLPTSFLRVVHGKDRESVYLANLTYLRAKRLVGRCSEELSFHTQLHRHGAVLPRCDEDASTLRRAQMSHDAQVLTFLFFFSCLVSLITTRRCRTLSCSETSTS